MRRRLRTKLVTGVALVAVVVGVTAAVVMAAQPAKHGHTPARHGHTHGAGARGGMLVSAAGYLGLSPAQVRGELQSGKSLAEIASATRGKSSAGLIEALEAAQKQRLLAASASLPGRVSAAVDRVHGNGVAATAARYLGVSAVQLRHEERAGESLAQIANATSEKSVAGLIEALVAPRKAALSAEVAAGTITQAKANKVLPRLVGRVTARVNRVRKHRTDAEHRADAAAPSP